MQLSENPPASDRVRKELEEQHRCCASACCPGTTGTVTSGDVVWYASYGSNMHADRFACYLRGGALPGMGRVYPGARDNQPPRDARGVWLDGEVYFALESLVWGGGVAFLDTTAPRRTPAQAYLITLEQFADVVDQEMGRAPGGTTELDGLLSHGRLTLGPGRYEALVVVGEVDGVPVATFTSPTPMRPFNAPSAAYLRMLAGGLTAGHGWSETQVAAHLASLPGAGRSQHEVRDIISGGA